MTESRDCLILHKPFDAAHEFLDFVRLSNPIWGNTGSTPKSEFLFRGHWDSDWELKPPAWRDDGRGALAPILGYMKSCIPDFQDPDVKGNPDWYIQLFAEIIAIKTFYAIADEQGLEIPYIPRKEWLPGDWFSHTNWANRLEWFFHRDNRQFLEIVALAQHHGVPTRLLDWTRDPRVAAYFAATNERELSDSRSSRLAVWAVNSKIFSQAAVDQLEVPRYKNAYLHAQEALFTYGRSSETLQWVRDHKKWPSLTDLKDKYFDGSEPPFVKATLPHSEAERLLALLYWEHISRARLMPTYESVAQTSKTFWRISPSDGKWYSSLFASP